MSRFGSTRVGLMAASKQREARLRSAPSGSAPGAAVTAMMGIYLHILIFAFCCVWTKTVVFRLSSDIAEVRETEDAASRYAIIAIWFLTAVAILWVGQSLFLVF